MFENCLARFSVSSKIKNAKIFQSPEKFISYWNEFHQFSGEPKKIILSSGGFDPIHPGHIDYLQSATSKLPINIGFFYSLVVVNGDSFLREKKGKPFMNLQTRMNIVSSIKGVDFVVGLERPGDSTVNHALSVIKPAFFAKGGDRKDASTIPEWETCQKESIQILLNCGSEKVQSSSGFLQGNSDGKNNES